MAKLKHLLLSNNKFEDINVFEITKFPILLKLKLFNNKIKDIKAFKRADFRFSLQCLNLSYNIKSTYNEKNINENSRISLFFSI